MLVSCGWSTLVASFNQRRIESRIKALCVTVVSLVAALNVLLRIMVTPQVGDPPLNSSESWNLKEFRDKSKRKSWPWEQVCHHLIRLTCMYANKNCTERGPHFSVLHSYVRKLPDLVDGDESELIRRNCTLIICCVCDTKLLWGCCTWLHDLGVEFHLFCVVIVLVRIHIPY